MENELLRARIERLEAGTPFPLGRGRADGRGDLAFHPAALRRAAGLPHLGHAALDLLSGMPPGRLRIFQTARPQAVN